MERWVEPIHPERQGDSGGSPVTLRESGWGTISEVVEPCPKYMMGISRKSYSFSSHKSTRGEENLADPTEGKKIGPFWLNRTHTLVYPMSYQRVAVPVFLKGHFNKCVRHLSF